MRITLDSLNTTYLKLHRDYENAFWDLYMGISKNADRKIKTEATRDAFRSDRKIKAEVEALLKKAKGEDKKRLTIWNNFFALFQIPEHAIPIRKKVAELEERHLKEITSRKEGYIDPANDSFVEASRNMMKTMMRTHPDEAIRKACFDAIEKLPLAGLPLYIEIIKGRNEYARALGFEDFYAYKARIDEDMTKDELFSIFDSLYEKTKYAFDDIRKLEKEKPGLRKPWNFGYMMTGDFVKEEDQYFQFENALGLWGTSFSAMGIDYKKGTLVLDLLNRKGKWDNGFCHYPDLVHYDKKGKLQPGESRFTSTAIPNQVGSGVEGIHTLFHEAGHAADRLNSAQREVCLNTEYPPNSISWSETQSMFMDSVSSSVEWRMRYAKNKAGEAYPFNIYVRKMKTLQQLMPLNMMGLSFVVDFEKNIYECKDLTIEKVLDLAKASFKKHFDRSEDSLLVLNVPHIYSWESSAYYHGYGLAELGVAQWRDYFHTKYGYIVDNPKVGKEMEKVWKFASLYKNTKLIKLATGKKLTADAYIKNVTRSLPEIISTAKERIKRLEKVPLYTKPVNLNAKISIMHGKKKIADTSKSFEDMERKFKKWIEGMK